jgi:small subunit ribosomal protein S18
MAFRSKSKAKAKAKKKKKSFKKKRICRFCADANLKLDYKEIKILGHFVTERGKIVPRRISGNCARHQRTLTVAIKRARHVALMPYMALNY